MKCKHKKAAALLSLVMASSMFSNFCTLTGQAADYSMNTGSACVESLDRGMNAIHTASGMLVSWRFLADDSDTATFNLYRDDTLIYTSAAGEATCYLDASGSASSTYRLETLTGSTITSRDTCNYVSGNDYFDLALNQPTSSNCTYSPNDCSVGDVDGDGEYELFVKWDPSNSQDNSKGGKTDKVYIDCYKMDGTQLWRIDLGWNIRAGAHYTQFLVADFDGDGCAEMTCKTSDGTTDGVGTVIGDASAVYRNSKGYILTGPEYYTLFDGATGAALDTVDYNPGRGTVSSWGDNYGNRCDRFLGAVVYLDGVHPSAVTVRGYYTRMTACAYDVVDKKLVQRWLFDSGTSSSAQGYGDGNHNCMPADVDGDGKQELVLGATCLDDDGSVLWCLNTGHGDAMHLGDFLPDRTGLELWICHEGSPYGVSLVDATKGSVIFRKTADSDTGRCCADNVWIGNDGAEFWANSTTYNGSGTELSCRRPAINFLSYWDGDLEREILDGYTDSPATISDMGENGTLTTLLSTDGYYTCNTTKGTPCLSADLFGDWREELIVRASDGKSVRIYCTSYTTEYRITTLMHDVQYRTQVAGENVCYNQPPHTSFYLGSDEALPARPNVTVVAATGRSVILDGTLIRNLNVQDKEHGTGWALSYNLAVGDLAFGDREFTYTALPDVLLGAEYVQTACDSKVYADPEAFFTTGDAITLYVAIDNRATTVPTWLGDWTATGLTLQTSNDVTMNLYQKEFASGEEVVLGSNGTSTGVLNYVVFAQIIPITLDGSLFTNMVVNDRENGYDWSIVSGLAVGNAIYGDRTVVFDIVPDALADAEYISGACDSKFYTGTLATFTAGADITLYVGVDTRMTTLPAWLGDWTATGLTASGDNDVDFAIYEKTFVSGEEVVLGENGTTSGVINYIVAAVASETQTLRGDIDLNGAVDAADVTLLQKWLCQKGSLTAEQGQRAELSGDTSLDAMDLAILKRIVLG